MTISHPIRRAKERYGLDLCIDDLANISKQIINGRAKKLGLKKGAELYEIIYRGQRMLLLFDAQRKRVITFRPWSDGVAWYRLHRKNKAKRPVVRAFRFALFRWEIVVRIKAVEK